MIYQFKIIMEVIDKVSDWNNTTLYDFLYKADSICAPQPEVVSYGKDTPDNIPIGWEEFFEDPCVSKEILDISDYIRERYTSPGTMVYPEITNVFRLFRCLRPENIKVFLCGQDPYHNKGSAIGLAFSVGGRSELCARTEQNNTVNPSLINIYKKVEVEVYPQGKYFTDSTLKIRTPRANGNISSWVKQGVFLINTALTVEEGKPNSHKSIWKNFSNLLLKYLCKFFSEKKMSVIWVLMGRESHNFTSGIIYRDLYKIEGYVPGDIGQHVSFRCVTVEEFSREKASFVNKIKTPRELPCINKVICCSHPSPLGMDKKCGIFSSFKDTAIFNTINDTLKIWGKEEIIF